MYLASAKMLHIPDGFLVTAISALTWLLSALALYFAVRKSQEQFDERLIPFAGIMAAFIFAGQMINFPVAFGTSGHLVGAALAAIALGPWLGILVMTAVISLQALLFQDGGLVVMGANILVMGVAPALIGFGLYRAVAGRGRLSLAVAAAAAWLSIMAAALVTALLLGFSGTVSFRLVVPAMLGVHALIGVGEALITVAALSFISRARPALLGQSAQSGGRGWTVGAVLATLFVILISPLASSFPDGLEWVAEEYGFMQQAREARFDLMPDYTSPALGEGGLSTIAAALLGALIVGLLVMGLTRLLRQPPAGARSQGAD
ncbi:MAG TPA: energy-coupling factor ABC transporter permease [Candidatus Sulfomarinibacteraceae bacterium]|nr:energy-coupling factor ABC transporter permease [Candidatus Sulfomarinibacteraceae bacterium]